MTRHVILRLAVLLAATGACALPAAASAAGDPASNRELSSAAEQNCAEDASGSACISAALADINAAHAAEGVRPMVLPSDFASMSVPVQLLNLSNLERVDRGLAPILGLAAPLNADAQSAAARDDDPMPTHFYGDVATGNWAAGYDSTLEADFAWMYDDGLGSDNLDCTNSDRSGCWGHRDDILWHFGTPIAMGAGYAMGQYGPSMTELFVGGDTRTGAGQPDAPVVRPSATADGTSGSGGAGGSAGTPTGHAASAAGHRSPRGWARSAGSAGRGAKVTVGCNGPAGRACTLRLALTVAGSNGRATVARAVVRVAAGSRTVLALALNRAGRRRLSAAGALRARLVVRQGSRVVLRRAVSLRRHA